MWLELQSNPVHAVAQAGWSGAIREDVAQVPAAACAVDLGPVHEETAIDRGLDRLVEWSPEAWPPGAALELCRGCEQRLATCSASERPHSLFDIERARPGSLGPVLSEHVELIGCERLFPLA